MAKKKTIKKSTFKVRLYQWFIDFFTFILTTLEKVFVVILFVAFVFYGLKISKSNDVSFFLTLSEISFTILGLAIVGFTLNGRSKFRKGLVKVSRYSTLAAVFSLITYMLFPFTNDFSVFLITIITITFYASMIAFVFTIKELYNLVQGYDETRKI